MKSFAEKLIIPLFLTVLLTSVTAEAGVAGHGAAAREAESGPGVNMTQAAEETSAAAEETEARRRQLQLQRRKRRRRQLQLQRRKRRRRPLRLQRRKRRRSHRPRKDPSP